MWPSVCRPTLQVAWPRLLQRLCQLRACKPAIAERQLDRQPQQPLPTLPDVGSQPIDVHPTRGSQRRARFDELRVPGANDVDGLPGPKPGVPLFQRSLIAAPVIHESWFHVEHAPVQVSPPLLRPLLDEAMNLRVD